MTGLLRVMGRRGDVVIRWDGNDDKSTERARAEFTHYKGDGSAFFGRRKRAKKTFPITEFDPNLAEVLVVPQISGG